MTRAPKLNEYEAKVLTVLRDHAGDFGYLSFATISANTGLERKVVRRACRSLTRKGLAEFARGLCTEDGGMAGSGYAAARVGGVFL